MVKNIKTFVNSFNLAEGFCIKLLEIVSQSKGNVNIALSGGNTPKIIFGEIVNSYKKKIDWKKVHFFWVDERCVPPAHRESNYGMAHRHLISHLNIPLKNIHRIKGENDPYEESARYSKEIKESIKKQNGIPRFNLIVLGLGEDGHTASIFPDQIKIMNSDNICEVAVHPESKQKRITLTGKIINNAEHILFLVSGKSKAEIVSKVLNETLGNKKYPASYIKPSNGILEWYLDMEASALL